MRKKVNKKKIQCSMFIYILSALWMGVAARAQDIPEWWVASGIINTNALSDDYGAANLGQLKHIALQTWVEMTNQLAQVATNSRTGGGVGDGHSLDSMDGGILDVLYVNESGHVGIGTIHPLGQLHVNLSNPFSGIDFTGVGLDDLNVDISGYTATVDTHYIVEIENDGPNPNWFKFSNDGGATWVGHQFMVHSSYEVGYGVSIGFQNLGGHNYGDRWEWTMPANVLNSLIVQGGRVGIGTETPSTALDVQGTITATAFAGDASGLTNLHAVMNETDPTVPASIKDGIDWSELTGIPVGLTNGENSFPPETDPVWLAEKNTYLTVNDAQQTYLSTTGGQVNVLTVFSSLAVGSATASGAQAVAQGGGSTASGFASHAQGEASTASGYASHAEGTETTASGEYSHAEGILTTASGSASHAEGWRTTASGTASHAGGQFALATNDHTYVWHDGTWRPGHSVWLSSTTTKQFTVHAAHGIRLLGGPISGDGSGLTNLQIDATSLDLSSLNGDLDMTGHKITHLAPASDDTDAANQGHVKTMMQQVPEYGDLSMGEFTGQIALPDRPVPAIIRTADLADGAVTFEKLADGSVTLEKMNADASEHQKGLVERATDAEAADGTDNSRYVTPRQLRDVANNLYDHVDATEHQKGIVERAADVEAAFGADNSRYITPKQLHDVVSSICADLFIVREGYFKGTWNPKLNGYFGIANYTDYHWAVMVTSSQVGFRHDYATEPGHPPYPGEGYDNSWDGDDSEYHIGYLKNDGVTLMLECIHLNSGVRRELIGKYTLIGVKKGFSSYQFMSQ